MKIVHKISIILVIVIFNSCIKYILYICFCLVSFKICEIISQHSFFCHISGSAQLKRIVNTFFLPRLTNRWKILTMTTFHRFQNTGLIFPLGEVLKESLISHTESNIDFDLPFRKLYKESPFFPSSKTYGQRILIFISPLGISIKNLLGFPSSKTYGQGILILSHLSGAL